MDYCPVTADTARYYADRYHEDARAAFVDQRTDEIYADLLKSDSEVEALIGELVANDTVSDGVLVACYRGDTNRLRDLVEAAAMKEAACRADAEALERERGE